MSADPSAPPDRYSAFASLGELIEAHEAHERFLARAERGLDARQAQNAWAAYNRQQAEINHAGYELEQRHKATPGLEGLVLCCNERGEDLSAGSLKTIRARLCGAGLSLDAAKVLSIAEATRRLAHAGIVATPTVPPPPGTRARKSRPPAKARALAVALEMVQEGEPLVLARIADRAGCSERYLHKCADLKAFIAANRGMVPRGRKDRDTGVIEAEDWPEDDG